MRLISAIALSLIATSAVGDTRMTHRKTGAALGFRTAYIDIDTGTKNGRTLHLTWQKNLPTQLKVTSNDGGVVASAALIRDQLAAVSWFTQCDILSYYHHGKIMYATTKCNKGAKR